MEIIKIVDMSRVGFIKPNLDFCSSEEIKEIVKKIHVERETVYGGGDFDILSIYPTCFGNS